MTKREEPEYGVPKADQRRLALFLLLFMLAFASGIFVATYLDDLRWDVWGNADDSTRDEQVLGDETNDSGYFCSETEWTVSTANSQSFRFTELTDSPNGSYSYAGGCQVHFEVYLDGQPAGEAVVEIESLESFPREIPWGPETQSACTRKVQATSDLFEQILAADDGVLPDDEACRFRTEAADGDQTAVIWGVDMAYEDHYDYVSISLVDQDPASGGSAARLRAFGEFFAGEFWDSLRSSLWNE